MYPFTHWLLCFINFDEAKQNYFETGAGLGAVQTNNIKQN